MHDAAALMQAEAARLKVRVEELEKALLGAIDAIQHWSSFASDYGRDKYDLDGDLAHFRAIVRKGHDDAPPA